MNTNDSSLRLLIKTILGNTCFKTRCYNKAKDNSTNDIFVEYTDTITLQQIAGYFAQHLPTVDRNHVPCVISILHSIHQLVMKDISQQDSGVVQEMVLLSKRCLDPPSSLIPCTAQSECENVERYNKTKNLNIKITCACFHFYLDLLFSNRDVCGTSVHENGDDDRISSLSDSTQTQKAILKTTAAKAFSLACCRLGKQPWTNDELKDLSSKVCQCIRASAKCASYSVLLSGTDNEERSGVLFQNGLLGLVIDELKPTFHSKLWKKNLPNIHSLVWCVKNVKYPHLDKHISKIVPPLLLLVDDYVTEHKLLGILTSTHFVENVNPSELRLYNHDAVIYDALKQQLYASESSVQEATLTCLLKLLSLLYPKSEVIDGITFSAWDRTFEKIMENIEMSSKLEKELVLLKFIPSFIERMGGNVMKHLDRLIKLLSWPIHGYGTLVNKKRKLVFGIMGAAIKSCWPVLSSYQNILLKLILRILIDVYACKTLTEGRVETADIEEDAYQVLCLLLGSCDHQVRFELNKVAAVDVDQRFLPLKRVVTRVLERDENTVTP